MFLKSKECKGNRGDSGQWGNPELYPSPQKRLLASHVGVQIDTYTGKGSQQCVCLSCLWFYQLVTLK